MFVHVPSLCKGGQRESTISIIEHLFLLVREGIGTLGAANSLCYRCYHVWRNRISILTERYLGMKLRLSHGGIYMFCSCRLCYIYCWFTKNALLVQKIFSIEIYLLGWMYLEVLSEHFYRLSGDIILAETNWHFFNWYAIGLE